MRTRVASSYVFHFILIENQQDAHTLVKHKNLNLTHELLKILSDARKKCKTDLSRGVFFTFSAKQITVDRNEKIICFIILICLIMYTANEILTSF